MNILIVSPLHHPFERFVGVCKANGWSAHVLTAKKTHIDFSKADRVIEMDSYDDFDRVLANVAGARYSGIVSAFEFTVPLVEKLSQALGLPNNDVNDAWVFRDKEKMRNAFARAEVPQPQVCARFSSMEEVESFDWRDVRFPVIVKPVDAVASICVRRCDTPQEVMRHLPKIFSLRRDEIFTGLPYQARALMEECIEGKEYSAECIVADSKLLDFFVHEKYLSPYPDCDELGEISRDLDIDLKHVRSNLERIVKAWKLKASVMHAEFKWDAQRGFKVIEVANRVGGGHLSELVQRKHGWHLEEALIRLRCGLDVKAAYHQELIEPFPVYGQKDIFHGEDFSFDFEGIHVIEHVTYPHARKVDSLAKYHMANGKGYVLFAAHDYEKAVKYMNIR